MIEIHKFRAPSKVRRHAGCRHWLGQARTDRRQGRVRLRRLRDRRALDKAASAKLDRSTTELRGIFRRAGKDLGGGGGWRWWSGYVFRQILGSILIRHHHEIAQGRMTINGVFAATGNQCEPTQHAKRAHTPESPVPQRPWV